MVAARTTKLQAIGTMSMHASGYVDDEVAQRNAHLLQGKTNKISEGSPLFTAPHDQSSRQQMGIQVLRSGDLLIARTAACTKGKHTLSRRLTRQERNRLYELRIVTSTSTPGSSEIEVICLTISLGECRSIRRLWMRISKRSQVLEPSPQGDLRVVWVSTLVGRRTGPLTRSCLSLLRETRSVQTEKGRRRMSVDRFYAQLCDMVVDHSPFSRFLTFLLVNVIRILWICGAEAAASASLSLAT